MNPAPRFILASRSPRRIALLGAAGYAFDVEPADLDEDDVPPGLAPADLAGHLARAKALAVARSRPGVVVLGADTVVAVGARTFGRAETHEAARAMLAALAGRRQEVLTGVAVVVAAWPDDDEEDESLVAVERGVVEMRPMSDAELDAYVASERWRGKAGAYGIQDHDPDADPFVRLVEGTMDTVVGLPMATARRLLGEAGVRPRRGIGSS